MAEPAVSAALVDSFECAICLELLHKPAVNHCGHAFCFWCFHHSMGLASSQCPLCRTPFKHLAAVCKPLHYYLHTRFPSAAAEREEQVKQTEVAEQGAESPDLPVPEAVATGLLLNYFRCAGCNEIAAPPAVLTCGHIVHCYRPGGWKGCPVDGCVGRAPADCTTLATCRLVETILLAELPDYDAACSRACSSQEPVSASLGIPDQSSSPANTPSETDATAVLASAAGEVLPESYLTEPVEIHGLTSASGVGLNGRRGVAQSLDTQSNRLVVALDARPGSSHGRTKPTWLLLPPTLPPNPALLTLPYPTLPCPTLPSARLPPPTVPVKPTLSSPSPLSPLLHYHRLTLTLAPNPLTTSTLAIRRLCASRQGHRRQPAPRPLPVRSLWRWLRRLRCLPYRGGALAVPRLQRGHWVRLVRRVPCSRPSLTRGRRGSFQPGSPLHPPFGGGASGEDVAACLPTSAPRDEHW